jgi:hypothetical protein
VCGVQETCEQFLLKCGRSGEEQRRLFEEVKKAGGQLEGGYNRQLEILFRPCCM